MSNKIYAVRTEYEVNGYERTAWSSFRYGENPEEAETTYDNFKDWAAEIFCFKQNDKTGNVKAVYFVDYYGREHKITPKNFKDAKTKTQVIEYNLSDIHISDLAKELSATNFIQLLKDNGIGIKP